MKLLIIGASGVLGSRLYNDAIKRKWNVLGTYYSRECEGLFYLNLGDRKSIRRIFGFFKPELVVLAGGITDVDLCEMKPELAKKVNIDGTFEIVKNIKKYKAGLAYLSTDYIFDGEKGPYSEDAASSPINFYGRTKLKAENIVRHELKRYLIVRTSQLYGLDCQKKNFAVKIMTNMRSNRKVYAADDFYSTPTYAGSLSQSIIGLAEKGSNGVFNIAGKDFLDRYSYVSMIADIFNLKKSLIEKVSLKDLRLKAKRPPRAGLKVEKAEKVLGPSLIKIEKGLSLFKGELDKVSYEM